MHETDGLTHLGYLVLILSLFLLFLDQNYITEAYGECLDNGHNL